jgi:uncharacterized protein
MPANASSSRPTTWRCGWRPTCCPSRADLRARLHKAIDYAKGFSAAQIDGSEGREIVLPMRTGDPLRFDGEGYLKHFVLPNVYFHCSMTYALLRHAGVPVGKGDFLGR